MRFRFVLPALALAEVAVLAAGCAGIRVYDSDSSSWLDKHGLPGIPFNVKTPILVQTTQRSIKEISLVVTVAIAQDKSKSTKNIPPTPLLVPQTPSLMAQIDDLRTYIDRNAVKDADELMRNVTTKLGAIQMESDEELKRVSTGTSSAFSEVISNTVTVETIIVPKQYYFEPVTPLIGSNDVSLELGSDGTLSKAETKIQDDTAKTLLAMIPVAPLLSKAWGITSATKGYDGGGTGHAVLNLTVVDASAVYTLKKLYPDNHDFKQLDFPPLDITDGVKGSKGVTLVSVGHGSKSEDKGKEKPAYEITGKIVLPDAAAGTATKK